MFYGVFIGIDRYQAPVRRLSYCTTDALTLSTLFLDTYDGDVKTLLDSAATREAITTALEDLSSVNEDDLVVVSFSGHGTRDHRLVPSDVDTSNLLETCVSLDEVAQRLDAIPARNLIVVLDCCFSGGFGGARVFAPEDTRDPLEDRSEVVSLARGSSRIVLTASGAGEPALESADYGHGLFTYYLVDALQGGGGISSNGQVSVGTLMQQVLQRVQDAAERMREVQRPTVYGSVEGAPSLRVLVPGASYAAAFPHLVRSPVTADWFSLSEYGISHSTIQRWAQVMPGLNELQLAAVNDHGVLDGRSLLVVAPTGAGKTLVGELTAMKAATSGSRAVILLPLKALVNDKYAYMTELYGDAVRVVRATGEFSDEISDVLLGQYDLGLFTYEKFANLVLGSPYLLRDIASVIVDEAQMIADQSRGSALEFLLTLLRSGAARSTPPQIVALSAVIGDTRGLERWIGGSLLRHSERPVPLREAVLTRAGDLLVREPDGAETRQSRAVLPENFNGSTSSKPWLIPLVRKLVSEGKKVVVFRSTRGDSVGTALYLSRALGLDPASAALTALPSIDRPSASHELQRALEGGVGFHNSDLDRDERVALEEAFRDSASPLRVLVATTTLAMGVNTPAEAVVIAGLRHFNVAYSVAEYKNMVGRAGRPGYSDAGESYLVATADPAPQYAWDHYVWGEPESLSSQFLGQSTDSQTLLVRSLRALRGSAQEEDVIDLLENSFAVWLLKEGREATGWDRALFERDLAALVDSRLVDREPGGVVTLTALGRYAGESGIEVRSIAQVSSALRFAPANLSAQSLVALSQVTVELDQMYISSNRKSLQEQRRWPETLAALGVPNSIVRSLHVGGGDPLLRCKRACASLMFAGPQALASIETQLLRHTRETSSAGQIRQISSRVRDVIGAVAVTARFFDRQLISDSVVDDLLVRLEIGLPEELVDLARSTKLMLTRGQYLALAERGIGTAAAVRNSEIDTLAEIVGADLGAALLTVVR